MFSNQMRDRVSTLLSKTGPVWHFLFGSHTFDLASGIIIGIGAGMALSADQKDIAAARWFFAIAALLAIGRLIHWLATANFSTRSNIILAVVIFAMVGACWVTADSWVSGKLSVLQEANRPVEFKYSRLLDNKRKDKITKDLIGFKNYWTSAGLDFPAGKPYVAIVNQGGEGTSGPLYGKPTYYDNVNILERNIDDGSESTMAYASWVVTRLMGPVTPLPPEHLSGLGEITQWSRDMAL